MYSTSHFWCHHQRWRVIVFLNVVLYFSSDNICLIKERRGERNGRMGWEREGRGERVKSEKGSEGRERVGPRRNLPTNLIKRNSRRTHTVDPNCFLTCFFKYAFLVSHSKSWRRRQWIRDLNLDSPRRN